MQLCPFFHFGLLKNNKENLSKIILPGTAVIFPGAKRNSFSFKYPAKSPIFACD